MSKIRIILVDDHQLFIDGINTILLSEDNIEVIDCVLSGDALLKSIITQEPDLVLLDISMPGMDGIQTSEHILKHHPSIKVLIITMNDSIGVITTLMKIGVNGILFKNTNKQELLQAIQQIANGDTYYCQAVTKQLAKSYKASSDNWQLTKREREVLQLIYEGYTTTQIAEKLFLSIYTVETHRKNLFSKTGHKKSVQLINQALELGYINRK